MKKFLYILCVTLLFSPISIWAEELNKEEEIDEKIEIVTLDSCVDGDTARFKTPANEIIKVRFLAIDTPETVHPTVEEQSFGKEASEYTCTALTNATEIKLEYDKNSKEEDVYGRKLVWVFTDDVLLQESLVSMGYAKVAYLYADYKYTSLLQISEETAKMNHLGIWSLEEESVEQSVIDEPIDKENKKNKNFFEKILDQLLASVFDFINDLLESILKFVEDML